MAVRPCLGAEPSPLSCSDSSCRALLFSSSRVLLLDGSWHHLAVSVSNTPGVAPFEVFVDGESWQPDLSESSGFLWKGLSLGGRLSLGQLEGAHGGESWLSLLGMISSVVSVAGLHWCQG